jgi:hypothetical protein
MDNDSKAVATLVVVAFLILGMFIWTTAGSDIRPSFVSGLFTLAAAIGAVFVAFYQLRRQGENAAASNLHSEKLKLKKDIYSTVIATCDECSNALGALRRYVLEGFAELQEHRSTGEDKSYGKAQFSVDQLTKRYNEFSKADLKLFSLIEKWRIVEPRLPIFQKAFTTQSEFLGGAFAEFLTGAYRYFRTDAAGTWLFKDPYVDAYHARMDALFNEILGTEAFIHDFQVAMQNALLGELFGRTLELRKPPNPAVVVVDLDKVSEVEAKLADLKKRGRTFDTETGLNSLSTP